MTDKQTGAMAGQGNMEKDPKDWVTGDEPMTGAQRSYLKTLSEEAREPFDENLSKADASRRIEQLQERTGRGAPARPEQPMAQAQDGQAPSAPQERPAPDLKASAAGQPAEDTEADPAAVTTGYTGA